MGATGPAAAPSGVGTTETNGQAAGAESATKLTPDAKAAVAEMRQRLHGAIGQIVLALAAVPRYRHQTLGDLQTLVLEPLMRDRVAIAVSKGGDERDPIGGSVAGIAFWASVSDEVDAKIREQIKSGVFPVRLKPDEWTSGDKAWLLDVVAPSQKVASSVLANFRHVLKGGDVRIHPVIAKQMDPEVLKKLGAAVDGSKQQAS